MKQEDCDYIQDLIDGAATVTVRSAQQVQGGQPQARIGGSLPPIDERAQCFANGEQIPHLEFTVPFTEAPRLGQQYRVVLIPVTGLQEPLRTVDIDQPIE